MNKIYKILFLIIVLNSQVFGQLNKFDKNSCTDDDNFFVYRPEVDRETWCSVKNPKKSRFQSASFALVNKFEDCNKAYNFDISETSKESISAQKKQCQEITSCLDTMEVSRGSYDTMDPAIHQAFCSTESLKTAFEKSQINNSFEALTNELSSVDSIDSRLNLLDGFIQTNLDEESKKNIVSCKKVQMDQKCFDDFPGLNADFLKNVKKQLASKKLENSFNKKNGDIDHFLYAYSSFVENQVEEKNEEKNKENDDAKMDTNSYTLSRSQSQILIKRSQRAQYLPENAESSIQNLSNNLKNPKKINLSFEKIKNELRSKGLGIIVDNFNDLSLEDYQSSIKLINPHNKKKNEFLVSLINKIYEKNCDKSFLYDENKICKRITNKLKESTRKPQKDYVKDLVSYLKSPNNKDIKNLNPDLIMAIADGNTLFDYNAYLFRNDKYRVCVNSFHLDSFGEEKIGKLNKKERYDLFQQRMFDHYKQTEKTQLKIAADTSAEISRKLSNSNDNGLKELATDFKANYAINSSSSLITTTTSNQNDLKKEATTTVSKNLSNESSLLDNSISTFSNENSPADIKSNYINTNRNQTNNFGNVLTSPIIDNTSVQNTTSVLQAKLNEAEVKEKILQEKLLNKDAPVAVSDEMKSLQKQIEDLKNQMTSAKITSNAEVKASKNNFNSNLATPSQNITSAPIRRDDSFATRSTDSYLNKNERIDNANIQSTNRSSESYSISSPAIKSTNSSANSNNSAGKSLGLVLTKAGEVTDDLNKVADNPIDADIFALANKSNGRPFLIRENGQLVQVSFELNKDGTAKLIDGRPIIIKKKLSSRDINLLKSELNPIREAKKIDNDAVRLKELHDASKKAFTP